MSNPIAVYQDADIELEIRLDEGQETIWATQQQIAGLFGKDTRTISEHINNIYKEEELEREATTRKFRVVQDEGGRMVSRDVTHYNLDMVLSVGYRMEEGQLVPDEEQAPFVRTAFHRYATGNYSIKALSKTLRAEGLRFLPSMPTVPKSTLERMLKRRVYIGDVEFKGEIYPGKHPPLVSMDLWIMVQKALKKDNKPMKSTKHHFRYQGIFTCGACDAAVTGDIKKEGKYIYYRCNRAMRNEGCTEKHVNQDKIDRTIEGMLASFRFPPSFKDDVLSAVTELDGIKQEDEKQESRQLQQKIDRLNRRLRQAYEDRLSGVIDETMYQQVSKDYREEISELQLRLAQTTEATLNYYELAKIMFELPETLSMKWFSLPDEKKGYLINLMSSNCKLKDGNPLLELHPVFDYLLKLSKVETGALNRAELEQVFSLHSETITRLWQALTA